MTFKDKLERTIKKNNSLVCVGLDSEYDKVQAIIPKLVKDMIHKEKMRLARHGNLQMQFLFNKYIIEATHNLVCSYKLNTAFYEAIGLSGLLQLKLTTDYLKDKYPEIPIIIDAKRGDIGNTNNGYVQFVFNHLNGDAVTVNPYLGEDAIRPFLDRKDKGIIILCRTSNPGAGEFQDLYLTHGRGQDNIDKRVSKQHLRSEAKNSPRSYLGGESSANSDSGIAPLPTKSGSSLSRMTMYQYIAYQVAHKWNYNKNCLLVVGATYPEELKEVRRIVGDEMAFLVPGIGAQGGDLEATLEAGLNSKKTGLIINSSRGIIFADNPRREARKLKEEINQFR